MIWTSVSVGAQPASSAPCISVNPANGQPGQMVQVAGSGFGGGTCGTCFRPNTSPAPGTRTTPIAGCAVDGNGGVTGNFEVPSVSPGGYNIWACTKISTFLQCASTGFKVDPPPTTTTAPATTTTPIAPTTPADFDTPANTDETRLLSTAGSTGTVFGRPSARFHHPMRY